MTSLTECTYRPRKYVSVSTLLSFARCPRKYFYEKCGLSGESIAIAAEFGTAMHKAFPVALTTNDADAAYEAFLSVWTETEEKIQELGVEPKPQHNRDVAKRILQHYVHSHSGTRSIFKITQMDYEETVQVDEKTSDYEVPWVLDIGLDIPLVGRFDSFCEHRDTGEPWILEFKTTSRLNSQFFDAHYMSPQNLVYTLVASTILNQEVQGIMVEGVLVNAKKVDNMTQPIPTEEHHLHDIMIWLRTLTNSLLACEKLADNLVESYEDRKVPELLLRSDAFLKNFAACTPYPYFYVPMFRCGFADLCGAVNWTNLLDFYSIRPEHDFFESSPGGETRKDGGDNAGSQGSTDLETVSGPPTDE